MGNSYLGIHFIPTHTGQHHYDHIRRVKPGIMKTVGGELPDVQALSDVYQAAPDAIHYWRNHALSEQHADLWRDPVHTAERHVAELHVGIMRRFEEAERRGLPLPQRNQVRILGINEPIIEQFARLEDGRNLAEWTAMMNHRAPLLDNYMATFGEEAVRYGYGAGLGNFSTGQTPNRKPGELPTFTWFPKTIRVLERHRGRLALACHEYFSADKGPEGWWDWHTHRFAHYEVDCDIHILECGIDHGIIGRPREGWRGQIDAAGYAAQMETYIRRCMTDPRFGGATPFTLDGSGHWTSFYIEDAMTEFEALADRLREPTQQHTVHIPVVIGPPATQPDPEPTAEQPVPQPGNFERALAFVLRWEGGWADNPNDPGGATMQGITLATFTRWRLAQGMGVPTKDDLRAIKPDERDAIFYQWYWLASKAHELPWPLCLAQMDTAVNGGVGRAEEMLAKSNGNFLRYMGHLIEWYTRIPNWEHFGKGWIRRRADLLLEASN